MDNSAIRAEFVEWLMTGSLRGIYAGMTESELIQHLGPADSVDYDETTEYTYDWFTVIVSGPLWDEDGSLLKSVVIAIDGTNGLLPAFNAKTWDKLPTEEKFVSWLQENDIKHEYVKFDKKLRSSKLSLHNGFIVDYQKYSKYDFVQRLRLIHQEFEYIDYFSHFTLTITETTCVDNIYLPSASVMGLETISDSSHVEYTTHLNFKGNGRVLLKRCAKLAERLRQEYPDKNLHFRFGDISL